MKCIVAYRVHEWIDTDVHLLSDETIMILKHELLQKVCELSNEMNTRENVSECVESHHTPL